jgi:hypothetical protein
MIRNIALVLLAISTASLAQKRFDSGELKGFTQSPTEHMIMDIEKPFTVTVVQGIVLLDDGYHDPLREVIFEIRGPGKAEKVRGTKTDDNGQFRMPNVPEGTYKFKATLDGYQSVVGTIIVSRDADRRNAIKIDMSVGV